MRKIKQKDLEVGDRVARVFPQTTVDGDEGTVMGVLRIGGAKAQVHNYTVKMDNGELLHPFPAGVRQINGNGQRVGNSPQSSF